MVKYKCFKTECPICHIFGLAQIFLNKDAKIRYCRVRHYKGLNELRKPQFTYHKTEDLDSLKTLLKTQDLQFPSATGQNGQRQPATHKQYHEQNSKNQPLNAENKGLGSLAWWGTALVRTTSDLTDFKHWLETKEYAKSYIQTMMPYAKKYSYILNNGNLRDLDLLPNYKKAHAVKALTLLSKFRGNYTQFKAKLAEHGIK